MFNPQGLDLSLILVWLVALVMVCFLIFLELERRNKLKEKELNQKRLKREDT